MLRKKGKLSYAHSTHARRHAPTHAHTHTHTQTSALRLRCQMRQILIGDCPQELVTLFLTSGAEVDPSKVRRLSGEGGIVEKQQARIAALEVSSCFLSLPPSLSLSPPPSLPLFLSLSLLPSLSLSLSLSCAQYSRLEILSPNPVCATYVILLLRRDLSSCRGSSADSGRKRVREAESERGRERERKGKGEEEGGRERER